MSVEREKKAYLLIVVVVCFIQRPSKYVKPTHITTYTRKEGNSDRTLIVKACNIHPYNEFKNSKKAWSLHRKHNIAYEPKRNQTKLCNKDITSQLWRKQATSAKHLGQIYTFP